MLLEKLRRLLGSGFDTSRVGKRSVETSVCIPLRRRRASVPRAADAANAAERDRIVTGARYPTDHNAEQQSVVRGDGASRV